MPSSNKSDRPDSASAPAVSRELRHRILVVLALIGGLALIYLLGTRYLNLQTFAEKETQLRSLLKTYPVRSFVVCFAVYFFVSFVPGTTGKSFVVAWLFGFWQGLVIVNVALTLAATSSLGIGRYFLREIIAQRWQGFVTIANEAIQRDGGFYLLLLRLLHAPFTIVNYALGATAIKTRTFWWATQLGVLPGNIVFVYVGARLPSIQKLSEDGMWSLLDPQLIFAFVLLTVAPLLIRWITLRFWPQFRKSS